MNIYKIVITSPESADHEYRVSSVKEIVEFVNAQFTDVEHMPLMATRLTIDVIPPYVRMENGGMMDNPDWKT